MNRLVQQTRAPCCNSSKPLDLFGGGPELLRSARSSLLRPALEEMGFGDVSHELYEAHHSKATKTISYATILASVEEKVSQPGMRSFLLALATDSRRKVDTSSWRFSGTTVEEARSGLQHLLTKHQVRLADLFQQLDDDGSFTLDLSELRDAMWELGFAGHASIVDEIFQTIDADGSGHTGFEEFSAWVHGDAIGSTASMTRAERVRRFSLKGELEASAQADEPAWSALRLQGEFHDSLRHLGLSGGDIVRSWDVGTKDGSERGGDGAIGRLEYMIALKRLAGGSELWYGYMRAAAQEAFLEIDRSSDGVISVQELCVWLDPVGVGSKAAKPKVATRPSSPNISKPKRTTLWAPRVPPPPPAPPSPSICGRTLTDKWQAPGSLHRRPTVAIPAPDGAGPCSELIIVAASGAIRGLTAEPSQVRPRTGWQALRRKLRQRVIKKPALLGLGSSSSVLSGKPASDSALLGESNTAPAKQGGDATPSAAASANETNEAGTWDGDDRDGETTPSPSSRATSCRAMSSSKASAQTMRPVRVTVRPLPSSATRPVRVKLTPLPTADDPLSLEEVLAASPDSDSVEAEGLVLVGQGRSSRRASSERASMISSVANKSGGDAREGSRADGRDTDGSSWLGRPPALPSAAVAGSAAAVEDVPGEQVPAADDCQQRSRGTRAGPMPHTPMHAYVHAPMATLEELKALAARPPHPPNSRWAEVDGRWSRKVPPGSSMASSSPARRSPRRPPPPPAPPHSPYTPPTGKSPHSSAPARSNGRSPRQQPSPPPHHHSLIASPHHSHTNLSPHSSPARQARAHSTPSSARGSPPHAPPPHRPLSSNTTRLLLSATRPPPSLASAAPSFLSLPSSPMARSPMASSPEVRGWQLGTAHTAGAHPHHRYPTRAIGVSPASSSPGASPRVGRALKHAAADALSGRCFPTASALAVSVDYYASTPCAMLGAGDGAGLSSATLTNPTSRTSSSRPSPHSTPRSSTPQSPCRPASEASGQGRGPGGSGARGSVAGLAASHDFHRMTSPHNHGGVHATTITHRLAPEYQLKGRAYRFHDDAMQEADLRARQVVAGRMREWRAP